MREHGRTEQTGFNNIQALSRGKTDGDIIASENSVTVELFQFCQPAALSLVVGEHFRDFLFAVACNAVRQNSDGLHVETGILHARRELRRRTEELTKIYAE